MRPPGRGDCWILTIAYAPSPKKPVQKPFLPQQGSLSVERVFANKFQVPEKILFESPMLACGTF
jgi:hypothetical protein